MHRQYIHAPTHLLLLLLLLLLQIMSNGVTLASATRTITPPTDTGMQCMHYALLDFS
jgi:hypothetical protein